MEGETFINLHENAGKGKVVEVESIRERHMHMAPQALWIAAWI